MIASAAMPAARLAEPKAFEIGRTERYTGAVSVARLLAARDDSLRVYEVRFAAGARTVWHAHVAAQWLIGLVGPLMVQCTGETVRRLMPGEAILIPPGMRHWHGAGRESGASHLALNEGGDTTWERPLSAEEYAEATEA
jgi:4-carboxymuconolactone decarboxylase